MERTLTSAPPLRLYNKEADLVRSYFKANGLWTDLKRQFSIPNAGKAIHESTGEALTKFRETVAAFPPGAPLVLHG